MNILSPFLMLRFPYTACILIAIIFILNKRLSFTIKIEKNLE